MKKLLIAIISLLPFQIASAEPIKTLSQLIQRLEGIKNYSASSTYAVLLPNAADEITYNIDLQATRPGDRFSPCDYLIDWTLKTPSGTSAGFSSYSAGTHYRYRDQRLQEYHYDWDSIPLMTLDGGVQRNAQFTELLPAFIASKLKNTCNSIDYKYTFTPGVTATLYAEESIQGYTARKITYIFDGETAWPVSIHMELNPGEISEQEVAVKYSTLNADPIPAITEDALVERYSDIFSKYRRSNFKAENLPGSQLPAFSLPTITGERFSRNRNETFIAPTLIVMLDPAVATSAQTVADVRKSVATLPFTENVIWAFVTNNIDQIETLIGDAAVGETTLMSARSLARDLGVTDYPTLVFLNRDGNITAVQIGYNKNLPAIVMEKSALSN